MAGHPGKLVGHPGKLAGHPGKLAGHPGIAKLAGHPGKLAGHPGKLAGHPGIAKLAGRLGKLAGHPGKLAGHVPCMPWCGHPLVHLTNCVTLRFLVRWYHQVLPFFLEVGKQTPVKHEGHDDIGSGASIHAHSNEG